MSISYPAFEALMDKVYVLEQQRDKLLDGLKRAERETGFINCQDLSALIAEVEASK